MYEQEILALRPSKLGAKEKLTWLPAKDGEYNIKTGYQEVVRSKGPTNTQSPGLHNFNWITGLWNLQCAPEIKFFLWKALHNAIPVGSNLQECGINPTANCPHSGNEETGVHLLFLCPFAVKVWDLAPFKASVGSPQIPSIQAGFERLLQSICLPPVGLSQGPLFPWIIWTLWTNRNKKIFENKQMASTEVMTQAILQAKEWNANQISAKTSTHLPRSEMIQERKADTVRCSSDAAWREDTKQAGLGWIFEEQFPFPEQQGRSTAEKVSSPLVAEALAMRTALH
ncbi:PREDICTED: uncharacterized protein LOC109125409 [Camelina sativa]|uniref:Uncharacterized protein LOC109125409 n=1 Tax=Camelina sativa TaxID=90675 RepID=A0ABM1Q732_CAMSA|nr:PREDICTED: uncharacterized protein LOC109125409 [Camelina sativa]